MRLLDADIIAKTVKAFRKTEDSFDPIDWVSNPLNVGLQNSSGDIVLFEHELPGTVTGHYYFQSRGRSAITAGKVFLDEIFNKCYNIEVIRGLTPLTNLGARWLSRQLGFKSHGIVRVLDKPYELFILTKKEYMDNE